MEVVTTSETSVKFYQTIQWNIPEENRLHIRRHWKLKSQFHEQLRTGQVSLSPSTKPVWFWFAAF
jgi:hypothetical protein